MAASIVQSAITNVKSGGAPNSHELRHDPLGPDVVISASPSKFRINTLLLSGISHSNTMASSEGIGLTDYSRTQASGYEESGQSSLHNRALRVDEQEHEEISLPAADGGGRAWLFLAGSFMIEALIWGTRPGPLLNCSSLLTTH